MVLLLKCTTFIGNITNKGGTYIMSSFFVEVVMLESLFGNVIIEKIMFFLLVNEKCYALELKKRFESPLYSFQRALARLEKGGVISSYREGKTVVYHFNTQHPFLTELKAFLQKAYDFLPQEIQTKYYEPVIRKRPRRRGKPL